MLVTLLGIITQIRLLHIANITGVICDIPSGIVTVCKLEQLENAAVPIAVWLLSIFTEVKLLQEENAYSPMLITISGMVTSVNPTPLNALFPMLTTLPSVGIILPLQPIIRVFVAVSITQLL